MSKDIKEQIKKLKKTERYPQELSTFDGKTKQFNRLSDADIIYNEAIDDALSVVEKNPITPTVDVEKIEVRYKKDFANDVVRPEIIKTYGIRIRTTEPYLFNFIFDEVIRKSFSFFLPYLQQSQRGEEIVGFMKCVVEHEENDIYIPDYVDGKYNVLPDTLLSRYLTQKESDE
jgi:hypothetical protein